MGETFWGIFWGFIGGAVLTVIGSAVIVWFQGRREKSNRKKVLKTLMRELQHIDEKWQEGIKGITGQTITEINASNPLGWFNKAKEIGASIDLPEDVYADFDKAYRDLIQVATLPMENDALTGYLATQCPNLHDSLTKAIKSLEKYLQQ